MAATPQDVEERQAALTALRFVAVQLDRKAANAVWNAKTPQDRKKIIECIMRALKLCQDAIEACTHERVIEPKDVCDPGFHLEFDMCVPDP